MIFWFKWLEHQVKREKKKRAPHLIRKTKKNYKCFCVFKLVSQSQISWFFSILQHGLSDVFTFRLLLLKRKIKSLAESGRCVSDVLNCPLRLVWSEVVFEKMKVKESTEHFINSRQKVRYSSSIFWVPKRSKPVWQCCGCVLCSEKGRCH